MLPFLLIYMSNAVVALSWIDWPAVFVLIGVAGTAAEAWLRNKREEREARRVDDHLKYHDDRVDALQAQIDQLAHAVDAHGEQLKTRGIPMPPQGGHG